MINQNKTSQKVSYSICPLARIHLVGIALFQIAAIVVFVEVRLAAIPLAAFLLLCLAAPFIQRLRLFLPIIRRGDKTANSVGLTFDDGPDPLTTPLLLDLLAKHSVKATFFVVGEKVLAHPRLVRNMLERGHELGNHSFRHDVFLMLRRPKVLFDEILNCQEALKPFGVRPLAFRPPAGITNPYLFRILIQVQMYCAGFNCRGIDFGNRRVAGLAERILGCVRGGDVVLLHDRTPKADIPVEMWLKEVDRVLTGLRDKGLRASMLSRVINRPVMESIEEVGEPNQAKAFYDALADTYDAEQEMPSQSPVRQAEQECVMRRLPELLGGGESVLELGAGTGRFTLPIAQRAGRVLAIDLSGRMLDILGQKALSAELSNITLCQADFMKMTFERDFDLICSFSCLEYISDAEQVFRRLHPLLKDGGVLYFTIAHRSFFRFFVQVGNAVRQGIWLHARSRREIRLMLESAGFSSVEVHTHALKSVISSGVLMEVVARK